MRRRRSWRLAAGVALTGLVLSSCALPQEAGQSQQEDSAAVQAPKYLRELPFRDKQSLAQAARLDNEVLPIAPCALHDPEVASEVTGLPGDSIAPGDEINRCTLRLGKYQDISEGWVFDITVGPTLDGNYRQESQLVRISGSRFLPSAFRARRNGEFLLLLQRPHQGKFHRAAREVQRLPPGRAA